MGTAPRKVMHIVTRLVRGGAQLVVLELLRGLDPSRYQITLVAGEQTGSEGSLWPELADLGVRTVALPDLVREVSPLKDWKALRALRRVIREQRPDIVHSHTSKAGLLGSLAARQAGVPGVVLSPHGHILGAAAQIPGVPGGGWKRRLLAAAARRGSAYSDLVIAPNHVEREDGVRHGMWTREGSVTVPNGVDTRLFVPGDRPRARQQLRIGAAPTVGVVARLTREKGVDVAIAAMSHLDDVNLVVVGDGPEREPLENLARQLGVEHRVTLLGTRDRVEALLPAFDVVVIPSRTEAHGMVAAEALACALPVVCSDVGGLRSLVIPDATGIRVPADDPKALARAIRELFADPARAVALGRGGREHVDEHFSLRGMVERTEEIYEAMLAGDPTLPGAVELVHHAG